MININQVRENPDLFKKSTQAKGANPELIDQLLQADQKRRQLISQIESLRAEQNQITEELKKSQTEELISQATAIKEKIKPLEPELEKAALEYYRLLRQVPNPAAQDVPIGKDESENEVVKSWGEVPQLQFEPKDHLQIGENLDLIDVKTAAQVSGARFGYWKNEAVLIEFGLIQIGLKTLTEQGFIPVIPPVLIKPEAMQATGYLEHGGEEETYFLPKDELYLVATSEHSIAPLHLDQTLPDSDLPKRYVAFSTCFRREAGSYGKDTRGMLRVHQFNKMEMFVFTRPENSDQEHEFLLSLEEKLVQTLNLPYQVSKMCTGDLGAPAARKYDIEVWLPSQQKYRETHSVSTCTDFQSRRLNTKYQDANNQTNLVHTLNGTYFAQRLIIAILENYQQPDGSVIVPEPLVPYLGKEKITPKK